jgi:hypothetical protein
MFKDFINSSPCPFLLPNYKTDRNYDTNDTNDYQDYQQCCIAFFFVTTSTIIDATTIATKFSAFI